MPRPNEALRSASREAAVTETESNDRGDGELISFGAIGLAWELLKARPWTWFLASLTLTAFSSVAQAAVGFASVLAMSVVLTGNLAAGSHPNFASVWFYVATLLPMIAAAAVQGVLVGGLFRMALRQLDGETIRVSDVFSIGRSGLGMGVASALFVLGWYVGLMAFLLPGLVFMGLFAFVFPIVLDGHVGGLAAFRRSWAALRARWMRATLFHIVVFSILISAVVFLGVGVLFTFPLYVLSICAQYRRSFAPGAIRRPYSIENPYEDAVGVPSDEQSPARVPVLAWFLMSVGMSTPVLAVGGLIVLSNSIAETFRGNAARLAAASSRNLGPIGTGAPSPPRSGIVWPDGGFRGGPPRRSSRPIPSKVTREIALRFRDEVAAAQALRGDPATKQAAFNFLVTVPIDARSHHDEVMRIMVELLNDPGSADDAREVLATRARADDLQLLLEMLRSENEFIHITAWKILEQVGDESTAERLGTMLLNKSDHVDAIRGLRILGGKSEAVALKYLKHTDPDVRSAADKVLWNIGKKTEETDLTLGFGDIQSPDPRFRRHGLETLAKLCEKVPRRRSDVLSALETALIDPNENVRKDALGALAAIGDERIMIHLVRALEDPDVHVRAHAIDILSKQDDAKVCQYLLKSLKDLNPSARNHALDGLYQQETVDDLARVVALLADPFCAVKAKRLLIKSWQPSIQPEVIELLSNPSHITRTTACEVLNNCGDKEALEALRFATQDLRQSVVSAAKAAVTSIERRTITSKAQGISGSPSTTPK